MDLTYVITIPANLLFLSTSFILLATQKQAWRFNYKNIGKLIHPATLFFLMLFSISKRLFDLNSATRNYVEQFLDDCDKIRPSLPLVTKNTRQVTATCRAGERRNLSKES